MILRLYFSAAKKPVMAATLPSAQTPCLPKVAEPAQNGRARIGGSFQNLRLGQVTLHPQPALGQRLRMAVEALHVLEPRFAGQAIPDGQNNLRDNAQIAVHKHIQRMREAHSSVVFSTGTTP